MTILNSEKQSEIELVAVNAVGDLFKAVLNHESRLNQDKFEQTNYDDITMDFDIDDSEINTTIHGTSIADVESSVRSFNTSKSGLDDLMALEMYSSLPVGKKHALKKYDKFTLNTSSFWDNIGSSINPVMRFHEICVTKLIN